MKPLGQQSCSSCRDSFACGPESGEEQCWCDDLPRVSLVAREDQDCLCPKCLREAIQKRDSAGAGVHPAIETGVNSQYSLVAGEDYYLEGEAIVFTSRYHRRRGYCCESACRHCPYPGQHGG